MGLLSVTWRMFLRITYRNLFNGSEHFAAWGVEGKLRATVVIISNDPFVITPTTPEGSFFFADAGCSGFEGLIV